MEDWKADRLRDTYGCDTIPIKLVEGRFLIDGVKSALNLPADMPAPDVFETLYSTGTFISDISAEEEDFDFIQFLQDNGLEVPERVYLDWYCGETPDEADLQFFSKYLDDIWYPAADDIDIYDENMRWVVTLSHDGRLKIVRLR